LLRIDNMGIKQLERQTVHLLSVKIQFSLNFALVVLIEFQSMTKLIQIQYLSQLRSKSEVITSIE
jgi:hypothetical protein